jgi:acetoin utilization deacetylase AcuC-like enzyme
LKIFSSDRFELPLPDGHRFPIEKYRLLREAVEAEALVTRERLLVPAAVTDEDILRVHTVDYLARVQSGALRPREARRIGFPWSPQLVERSRRSVGGTLEAGRSALEAGCGVHLAGGTHHAFADRGEGFCVFNDVAIAVRTLQARAGVGRVAIVDCDVHQGNGTAAIFSQDPSVFTLSIHGRNNYPYRKEASDLDIELENGIEDDDYLGQLAVGISRLEERFSAEMTFFIAGVDPYAEDRYGLLGLSAAGLATRDRFVLEAFRRRGVPVAVVMGGGYARDPEKIARLHLQTVRAAVEVFGGRAEGAVSFSGIDVQ